MNKYHSLINFIMGKKQRTRWIYENGQHASKEVEQKKKGKKKGKLHIIFLRLYLLPHDLHNILKYPIYSPMVLGKVQT